MFQISGGCETVIVQGYLKKPTLITRELTEPKAVDCDGRFVIDNEVKERFSVRPLQIPENRTQYYLNHEETWIFNSSEIYFFLVMSTKTSIDRNEPYINVLLSQKELYSWVDIIIQVFRKNNQSSQITILFYMQEMLWLTNNTKTTLKKLGKFEDEMLRIHLRADQNSWNSEDKLLSVEMKTTFFAKQNLNFRNNPYTKISTFQPLSLVWKSNITLSKFQPYVSITLPGKPDQLKIRSFKRQTFTLQSTWMKSTKNKHKDFLNQDIHHGKIFGNQCGILLYCLNCKCTVDISTQGYKILPSWKTPKHSCLYMASLYENMFAYSRPYSCASNDHEFLGLLPFSVNHSILVCPIVVHCLKYRSPRNYFGLDIHFYTIFEFYFYQRNFRDYWKPCWVPSKPRKSWVEASFLCKMYGATLPILRSKDELNEVMTLLKHGTSIPPIEVLFIGLRFFHEVNKEKQNQ